MALAVILFFVEFSNADRGLEKQFPAQGFLPLREGAFLAQKSKRDGSVFAQVHYCAQGLTMGTRNRFFAQKK